MKKLMIYLDDDLHEDLRVLGLPQAHDDGRTRPLRPGQDALRMTWT